MTRKRVTLLAYPSALKRQKKREVAVKLGAPAAVCSI